MHLSRVEDNMVLVPYVMKRYFRGYLDKHKYTGISREDMTQIGMLGLVRADQLFDASRNLAFITYAVHKIRWQISRAIRDDNPVVKFTRTVKEAAASIDYDDSLTGEEIMSRSNAKDYEINDIYAYIRKRSSSMDKVLESRSNSENITLHDVISSDVNVEDTVINAMDLQDRLKILTPKRHRICSMLLQGELQSDIAIELGMSQSSVSRNVVKAIETIEEQYIVHP